MEQESLNVVLCAVIQDNNILLIKRVRGDYTGLIGLVGGKINPREMIEQTAIREVKEESGIDCIFVEKVGTVSEKIIEREIVVAEFMFHVCILKPLNNQITEDSSGDLNWYNLDTIGEHEDEMIPSDLPMIRRMVIDREKDHFDCEIQKEATEYSLMMFE